LPSIMIPRSTGSDSSVPASSTDSSSSSSIIPSSNRADPSWCVRRCCARLSDREKHFPHWSQVYGLSDVCVRRWRLRCSVRLNTLLHIGMGQHREGAIEYGPISPVVALRARRKGPFTDACGRYWYEEPAVLRMLLRSSTEIGLFTIVRGCACGSRGSSGPGLRVCTGVLWRDRSYAPFCSLNCCRE
jgi:hypothetical protein